MRRRGLSVRWQLTLSYTGFLVVAGLVLLAAMWLVLRYVPGGNITVVGGGFAPNRSDLVDAAVPLAVTGLLGLALVGLVGGWWLAGRMLRPLEAISAAARLAADGSLAHRIALPGADDEFRRLADVFDTMLARLESSFAEQRRFTANASHELRTPLSVATTLLEVARTDPAGPDVDRLLHRLTEVNDRSVAMLDALLSLSRADSGAVRRERVDLAAVVDAALEEVTELADARAVEVEADTAGAPVVGDPDLLRHLVANLLRNAVLHNVVAADLPRVRVRTQRTPAGGAVLVVENTGEVLHPGVVETLVEPFVRARGRTRSDGDGSGLGLSIVASVARAHGADLRLVPRPAGGLTVTVAFPVPLG